MATASNWYGESTLLGLPTEIREWIYSYAVVEDAFTIAYVQYATRTRREPNAKEGRILKESRASPQLPPLLQVNRQIRLEALPIFFRDNTFVFSLKGRFDQQGGDISAWLCKRGCERNLKFQSAMLNNLRTMIIEFELSMVDVFNTLYRHAEIGVKYNRKGNIELHLSNELGEKCTCWIYQLATYCGENMYTSLTRCPVENRVLDFAMGFEDLYREIYHTPVRHLPERYCGICGKWIPSSLLHPRTSLAFDFDTENISSNHAESP